MTELLTDQTRNRFPSTSLATIDGAIRYAHDMAKRTRFDDADFGNAEECLIDHARRLGDQLAGTIARTNPSLAGRHAADICDLTRAITLLRTARQRNIERVRG